MSGPPEADDADPEHETFSALTAAMLKASKENDWPEADARRPTKRLIAASAARAEAAKRRRRQRVGSGRYKGRSC